MRKILVYLSFLGTRYHGWQVQSNAATVQQTVQDALESILKERPGVTGCSRTDAGVHANEYAFHFTTASSIGCEALVRALNVTLPRDIAARRAREVPEDFHARYSVIWKEYIYKICCAPQRDPFWEGRALYRPAPADLDRMRAAALYFEGAHDFLSFCASGSSVQGTRRTVLLSTLERQEELLVYRVRADGFLYHMVRIMVGTLLDVSRGKTEPEQIPAILAARRREAAGPTAPAHGLYLNHVYYGGLCQ